jgi:hypothetical protein
MPYQLVFRNSQSVQRAINIAVKAYTEVPYQQVFNTYCVGSNEYLIWLMKQSLFVYTKEHATSAGSQVIPKTLHTLVHELPQLSLLKYFHHQVLDLVRTKKCTTGCTTTLSKQYCFILYLNLATTTDPYHSYKYLGGQLSMKP